MSFFHEEKFHKDSERREKCNARDVQKSNSYYLPSERKTNHKVFRFLKAATGSEFDVAGTFLNFF